MHNTGCTCRNAVASDIEAFYGEPQHNTIRAIVVERDEILGVIGVAREGEFGKFFCDFKEELTPYLKSITIMRVLKAGMKIVAEYKGPVIAVAEHAEGCRMLFRLGFTHVQGGIYEWPD